MPATLPYDKIYKMGEVEIKALKDTTFEIEKGELVCILGPSGAGKTTCLNILGGMDTLTNGKVIVDGVRIDKLKEKDLIKYRRNDIGFVFQFYNLIQNMNVLENVELATQLCKDSLDPNLILNKVGLKMRKNNFPSQLSGGEQQRVAIARALASEAPVILADEPTGNLDGVRSKQLMQYLEKVNREKNITVTHDPLDAAYSSQMYYIEDGKIKDHLLKKDDSFDTYFNKIVKISMEL